MSSKSCGGGSDGHEDSLPRLVQGGIHKNNGEERTEVMSQHRPSHRVSVDDFEEIQPRDDDRCYYDAVCAGFAVFLAQRGASVQL